MNREKTLKKLRKVIKSGYTPSRGFQIYTMPNSSILNCFAHACFNMTDEVCKENNINLSDSDSFRYFCDFSQDFTKKSLFYFIEETGLEIMPCEKHTSLKPNEWEIGLFFAIGDTDYDDFHFLLRENNNVCSSKFGYDAKIEKIKDKNVISYLNSNHSTSYYHLEGFYKLKNPYADSREK